MSAKARAQAFLAAPDKGVPLMGRKESTPQPAEPTASTPSVTPAATPTQDLPAATSAPDDVVDASAAAPADSATAPATVSATTDTAPAGDQQAVTTDDGNADGSQPRGKPRSEARIEDLAAQLKATKEYAEYLQQVNQQLMQPRQAAPAAPTQPVPTAAAPATDDPPPTLEANDFDQAKWARAHAEWTQRQIDKGVTTGLQRHTAQQAQQVVARAFETRLTAFKKSAPDFDVLAGNPNLPALHPDAAALTIASDKGPQIVYHFLKNPGQLAHVARMSPAQQGAAIGKLEAQLTAPAAALRTASQKTVSTTQAPAPPSVTPGSSPGPSLDPSRMSMADFVEHRRQEAAEKRNRRDARAGRK